MNANNASSDSHRGYVAFIGAGPGDPELLTIKAQRLIKQADVILYAGSLVNPDVLAYANPQAQIYNTAGMKLEEQVAAMGSAVMRGQSVARLHTGDPSIFGAIAEQIGELEKADIPYRIVPGVSSAFAAAASLGIELTLPEKTQTVIFTRLGGATPVPEHERLRDLAMHKTSLVIFLSVGMIDRVTAELLQAGYTPDTAVAVVARASWPDEIIVKGTLADIAEKLSQAEISHQALIIISPSLDLRGQQPEHRSHLYGLAMDKPLRQEKTAIVALTANGTRLGERLLPQLADTILYAPVRFMRPGGKNIIPYDVSVRQTLQEAFEKYSSLICIMSSGIVVREIAPLMTSKKADPAVVVVDESGRHAISLISGHHGGANQLAKRVAELLGGQAVLTTASDVQGLPALDLIGDKEGWRIAHEENLTKVMGALVNGETIGFVQDAGDESWIPDPLPHNLIRYKSVDDLLKSNPAAALLITTSRDGDDLIKKIPRSVVYYPRNLAVGIGCNRGTSTAEILQAIEQTLNGAGLATQSIACIATIEDKASEGGLLEVCRQRNLPLLAFSRLEIAAIKDLPNPSHWAQQHLNVPGVAEPAALLAANSAHLLVEKLKYRNVTVAVACILKDHSLPMPAHSTHPEERE